MAKINLNYKQETPQVVAIFGSLAVFVCLIFSLFGIKLWWFKRRLEFDQTTTQNGAAGGATPQVVVMRREKKSKFSKDKRWSQQVYHNVEVHGVFKPKKEEDTLIQRPAQLPPVRIRPSESSPSLILPPPRQKRRPQYVQSTAFEELSDNFVAESTTPSSPSLSQEIFGNLPNMPGTPRKDNTTNGTTATPSPTSSPVSKEEVSLTFKEVEKDLKLPPTTGDVAAVPLREPPLPPKRLNRSSSTSQHVQEKPHRFLKSSQSVSVPEYRKVIERRPTGFHRPAEIDDLTKIDDLDEPQFELFGDRRPTGYIKYEEVDVVDMELGEDYRFERAYLKSGNAYSEPIDALRDEEIIYQNPTSPDICEINEAIESFEKSQRGGGGGAGEGEGNFSRNNFSDFHKSYGYEQGRYLNNNLQARDYEKGEEFLNESGGQKDRKDHSKSNVLENSKGMESKNLENLRDTSPKKLTDQSRPMDFESYLPRQETAAEFNSYQKSLNNPSQDDVDGEWKESRPTSFSNEFPHYESFEEPQSFEEKPLKFETKTTNVHFSLEETSQAEEEKFTLNQRRPTVFPGHKMKEEVDDIDPQENSKTKYSSLKAFLMSEKPEASDTSSDEQEEQVLKVRFNPSQNGSGNEEEKFTLNQRRPTAFQRTKISDAEESDDGQRVKFNSAQDDEEKFTLNQRRPTTTYVREREKELATSLESNGNKIPSKEIEERQGVDSTSNVHFENPSPRESIEEKFTLNQRRPTAFVRQSQNSPPPSPTRVHFGTEFASENEEEKFTLNQRRPTAFVREPMERVRFANDNGTLSDEDDEEKFTLNQRRPTAYVLSSEKMVKFSNFEDEEEMENKFTLNQRRPTAYVRESVEETTQGPTTKIRFGDSPNPNSNDEAHPGNENQHPRQVRFGSPFEGEEEDEEDKFTLNQRRPTAFPSEAYQNHVRFQDSETTTDKFTLNQRRPTKFNNQIQGIEAATEVEEQVTSFMAQEDDYSFESSTFSSSLKYQESRPDIIWQELEKDIEKDFAQNIEEEFARIRQSLELNEADFLELKDDLQLLNSPIAEEPTLFVNTFRDTQIGNGFGKSIEEDWENFEKLSAHPEGIQVAYDEKQQRNGNASSTAMPTPPTTVSILKETKNDGPPTAKPRKSKVTFDSKTEERYIPARKSVSDEDDSDDDDDDENYSSPPIPSQRYQTRLNYGQENSADPIPLFGSISNNDQMEDSWSAIRKHRHMTEQFQMLSLDSNSSPPPPSYPPPPLPREEDDEDESDSDDEVIETPKPAYRNPMALLAAQRAKEARNDLGEFKGRSIKDAQKKRTSQEFVNLSDRFDDTEA